MFLVSGICYCQKYNKYVDTLVLLGGKPLLCNVQYMDSKSIDFSMLINDTIKEYTVSTNKVAKCVDIDRFSYQIIESKTYNTPSNKIDNIYTDKRFTIFGSINFGSRNKKDVFESAKIWFTNPTEGVSKSLLFFDSDSAKFTGKFNITFKPDGNSPRCIRSIGKVIFDVSIVINDTSCIYSFFNFYHTGAENAPGGPISFRKITSDNICPYDIAGDQRWADEQWLSLKKYINSKTSLLKNELKLIIVGH